MRNELIKSMTNRESESHWFRPRSSSSGHAGHASLPHRVGVIDARVTRRREKTMSTGKESSPIIRLVESEHSSNERGNGCESGCGAHLEKCAIRASIK